MPERLKTGDAMEHAGGEHQRESPHADMHEHDDVAMPKETAEAVVDESDADAMSQQPLCPVMGNPVVADVYTDFHGVRVYFCCPPCIKRFIAEPDTFVPKLPEAMQQKIKAAMQREADAAKQEAETAQETPAQTEPDADGIAQQPLCPVMDNPVVADVYTDFHGVRVYFCCPPCIKRFLDEPDQYITKLPASVQARIKAAQSKDAD